MRMQTLYLMIYVHDHHACTHLQTEKTAKYVVRNFIPWTPPLSENDCKFHGVWREATY